MDGRCTAHSVLMTSFNFANLLGTVWMTRLQLVRDCLGDSDSPDFSRQVCGDLRAAVVNSVGLSQKGSPQRSKPIVAYISKNTMQPNTGVRRWPISACEAPVIHNTILAFECERHKSDRVHMSDERFILSPEPAINIASHMSIGLILQIAAWLT